jgi:uncharacterized SAM-binding protein YcdF (DUF218 family)
MTVQHCAVQAGVQLSQVDRDMTKRTHDRAMEELFQFLAIEDELRNADIIIGFGVFDMRVPEHCARLHLEKYAPRILFTGGHGTGSGPLQEPEALVFRDRALALGVKPSDIIIESTSTNTLENVLFSIRTLDGLGLKCKSSIIVAQPHRQRRVWLTCRRWMTDITLINHHPPAKPETEAERFGSAKKLQESMRGEIERIMKYGLKGDIEADEVPAGIVDVLRNI